MNQYFNDISITTIFHPGQQTAHILEASGQTFTLFRMYKSKFTLSEKCPYSEFFWSVFLRIWTEYLSILSPNAGKYGPEKLRIWTLFT